VARCAGPLHTPLCDLLEIRHPVLLAGMAGGPGTTELVAAVSRAGGLGVFGATGMTADALHEAVVRARALCGDAPVGVNVQLAPATPGRGDPAAIHAVLAPVRVELGLPEQPDPPRAVDSAELLVEAALTAGARVVSAALGDPAPVAALARAAGAPLLLMVSSVEEARRSVAAGADALIAQGAEAGGHRTTFDLPVHGSVPLVGTFALVPQIVDAVDLPVVAAGGIADGRALVAALALGASGVSVGTRFLHATESGVSETYRAHLRTLAATDTVVTDAVTGRPARWVRNAVVDALAATDASLGWPRQGQALADVRAAAADAGRADLLPMLAGQSASLVDDAHDAAAIVRSLVDGALATIRALGEHARSEPVAETTGPSSSP
jgi:nitronate monooxygenase